MPPSREVLRNQSTPWSLLWSSAFSSQSHLQFAMPPSNVTWSQSPSNLPYPPSCLGISKTGTISMCSSNEVREIPSFLLIPSFWWQATERGEFLFFIRIVPPVPNSPSQLLVGKSLPLIRHTNIFLSFPKPFLYSHSESELVSAATWDQSCDWRLWWFCHWNCSENEGYVCLLLFAMNIPYLDNTSNEPSTRV